MVLLLQVRTHTHLSSQYCSTVTGIHNKTSFCFWGKMTKTEAHSQCTQATTGEESPRIVGMTLTVDVHSVDESSAFYLLRTCPA
jgi:hypothetical protein